MHWIHQAPLVGLDCQTTGDTTSEDLPVSCAITLHQHSTMSSPNRMPILINPGIPVPASSTSIHGIPTATLHSFGVPLPQALDAINRTLLDAVREGRALVAANARHQLTLLDRVSRENGVRTLHQRAAREGVEVRVLDPVLIDLWWDRYRNGKRTLPALCRHHGVRLGGSHRAQDSAVAAVELLRALMDLVADEDGTLVRLASGRWEGVRWLELRRCGSSERLHALLGRWSHELSRARQAERRRADPGHVEPTGWPLLQRG